MSNLLAPEYWLREVANAEDDALTKIARHAIGKVSQLSQTDKFVSAGDEYS